MVMFLDFGVVVPWGYKLLFCWEIYFPACHFLLVGVFVVDWREGIDAVLVIGYK